MITPEQGAALHGQIATALKDADDGLTEVVKTRLRRLQELVDDLLPDEDAPTPKTPLETVTFEWSTEKGRCQDCNLPAAYRLPNIPLADGGDFLLCSVDAAYHAAHGDEIEYLFEEEE